MDIILSQNRYNIYNYNVPNTLTSDCDFIDVTYTFNDLQETGIKVQHHEYRYGYGGREINNMNFNIRVNINDENNSIQQTQTESFNLYPGQHHSFKLNTTSFSVSCSADISMTAYSGTGAGAAETRGNGYENNVNLVRIFTTTPFGENQFTLTADDSFNSLFRFRKDTRDGLLDVISSKVRELGHQSLSQTFTFNDEEGSNQAENGNPYLFSNSERIRLIDGLITEVMYNTEQMLNTFGDPFVQSIYNQLYARLTNLRTYLNELITETVSATHLNLKRSQELVNILQRKVNEENIFERTIPINSSDIINKMDAILFKTNSRVTYNILDLIDFIEGEPIISFSSLTAIIGTSNKSNYFQPGYIKISPKSVENISINYHQNSLISFNTSLDLRDEDILGGSLIDDNDKSYKIINKINNELGLLDKAPTNSSNITKLIPNYFEQQIIQLNFSGQHNYVPALLPLGIELPTFLPQPLPPMPEQIIINPQITEEIRPGNNLEVNKEIG